jgi:hypothetical protein
MIIHDHSEIMSKNDINDEGYHHLKKASDGDVKYLIQGESFVICQTLNI